MSDAKTPFTSEQEYIQALTCHHAVMQCAMKAKQNVDPAVADQLAHAVGDFSKMYLPVGCASASHCSNRRIAQEPAAPESAPLPKRPKL